MSEWIVCAETVDDIVDGMFSLGNKIVRCKDCKRWDDAPITDESDHECHLFDDKGENEYQIRIATPSDWFCPMGERRSE